MICKRNLRNFEQLCTENEYYDHELFVHVFSDFNGMVSMSKTQAAVSTAVLSVFCGKKKRNSELKIMVEEVRQMTTTTTEQQNFT